MGDLKKKKRDYTVKHENEREIYKETIEMSDEEESVIEELRRCIKLFVDNQKGEK